MALDDVTRVLNSASEGDKRAADDLLPLIYDELRNLAAGRLARESPGQTLSATALVHEAYVRLVDAKHQQNWNSRGHFFAPAAEAMRRILVERARRKQRTKHGGELQKVNFDEVDLVIDAPDNDLLALDETLARFAEEEPEKAEFVKLRYFAGLTVEEAGKVLGISRATASRYWTYSRAWLYDALRES
ncbi:MAG: sigma-70 family RNA polymerase sigma factor [Planctomycetes bacterium]|nr:sigma-70 family RNA polymerase sigma factor [Planctomycetota bacterium]